MTFLSLTQRNLLIVLFKKLLTNRLNLAIISPCKVILLYGVYKPYGVNMELQDKLFAIELVLTYGSLLTEKQLSSVKCYYLFDMGLSEIAETENISRQGAYDLVTKSTNTLYLYEEKLGFVQKKQGLKKGLEKLSEEVKAKNLKAEIQKLKNILE